MFAGFGYSGDGGKEIWKGNVLLTEKGNPQWLNERFALDRSLVRILTKMADFSFRFFELRMLVRGK